MAEITTGMKYGLVALDRKFGRVIQGVVSIGVMNVTTKPVDVEVFYLSVAALTDQLTIFFDWRLRDYHGKQMETNHSPFKLNVLFQKYVREGSHGIRI